MVEIRRGVGKQKSQQEVIIGISRGLLAGLENLEAGRIYRGTDSLGNEITEVDEGLRGVEGQQEHPAEGTSKDVQSEVPLAASAASKVRVDPKALPEWLRPQEAVAGNSSGSASRASSVKPQSADGAGKNKEDEQHSSDSFLDFSEDELLGGESDFDDEVHLAQALQAQKRAGALLENLETDKRVDLVEQVRNWHHEVFPRAEGDVENLAAQESRHEQQLRGHDENVEQVREALVAQEMKVLLKVHRFLEKLRLTGPNGVKYSSEGQRPQKASDWLHIIAEQQNEITSLTARSALMTQRLAALHKVMKVLQQGHPPLGDEADLVEQTLQEVKNDVLRKKLRERMAKDPVFCRLVWKRIEANPKLKKSIVRPNPTQRRSLIDPEGKARKLQLEADCGKFEQEIELLTKLKDSGKLEEELLKFLPGYEPPNQETGQDPSHTGQPHLLRETSQDLSLSGQLQLPRAAQQQGRGRGSELRSPSPRPGGGGGGGGTSALLSSRKTHTSQEDLRHGSGSPSSGAVVATMPIGWGASTPRADAEAGGGRSSLTGIAQAEAGMYSAGASAAEGAAGGAEVGGGGGGGGGRASLGATTDSARGVAPAARGREVSGGGRTTAADRWTGVQSFNASAHTGADSDDGDEEDDSDAHDEVYMAHQASDCQAERTRVNGLRKESSELKKEAEELEARIAKVLAKVPGGRLASTAASGPTAFAAGGQTGVDGARAELEGPRGRTERLGRLPTIQEQEERVERAKQTNRELQREVEQLDERIAQAKQARERGVDSNAGSPGPEDSAPVSGEEVLSPTGGGVAKRRPAGSTARRPRESATTGRTEAGAGRRESTTNQKPRRPSVRGGEASASRERGGQHEKLGGALPKGHAGRASTQPQTASADASGNRSRGSGVRRESVRKVAYLDDDDDVPPEILEEWESMYKPQHARELQELWQMRREHMRLKQEVKNLEQHIKIAKGNSESAQAVVDKLKRDKPPERPKVDQEVLKELARKQEEINNLRRTWWSSQQAHQGSKGRARAAPASPDSPRSIASDRGQADSSAASESRWRQVAVQIGFSPPVDAFNQGRARGSPASPFFAAQVDSPSASAMHQGRSRGTPVSPGFAAPANSSPFSASPRGQGAGAVRFYRVVSSALRAQKHKENSAFPELSIRQVDAVNP